MQAQPVAVGRMTYNIFEDEQDDLDDLAFNQKMQELEQCYEQVKLEGERERKIMQQKINESCEKVIEACMKYKASRISDQEPEPSKVMETAKKVLLFIFVAFPVIAYKAARSMPSHTREFIAQRFLKRSFEAYDHIV